MPFSFGPGTTKIFYLNRQNVFGFGQGATKIVILKVKINKCLSFLVKTQQKKIILKDKMPFVLVKVRQKSLY